MIEIKDLRFRYPKNKDDALSNISLSIKEGEKVAIIGSNGSGKSTLAKMLIGLIKPAAGTVVVDGLTLDQKNLLKIRKKIGMVFQNPNLQFIGDVVESDIAFGLEDSGLSRSEMIERVQTIASQTKVEPLLKTLPQKLSGGQKQRIAIASILARNPKYLVFDEITSMLDTKCSAEIWELIVSMYNQKDKTIISVTHNMDEAALANRVIVLDKGAVIADGNPQEVLRSHIAKEGSHYSFEMEVTNALPKIGNVSDFDELVEALCK